MGKVIVTARLMPDNPNANLDDIGNAAKSIIEKSGEFGKMETKPIAFGLKAVVLYFVVPEKEGGTDEVEKALSAIPHVQSVEIVDVRRAL
jgi:elongation factor 1-beta